MYIDVFRERVLRSALFLVAVSEVALLLHGAVALLEKMPAH